MTAREYNLQLLKCIWSCSLCLTKIILSLIIIQKSIWSKVSWWLIGHVWIKGNLIPTAHLSKPLKHPSWNCCRLPDNIDQSQITPAYCKLAWDLHSLAERRKEIYNWATEKKGTWDCCCFLEVLWLHLLLSDRRQWAMWEWKMKRKYFSPSSKNLSHRVSSQKKYVLISPAVAVNKQQATVLRIRNKI